MQIRSFQGLNLDSKWIKRDPRSLKRDLNQDNYSLRFFKPDSDCLNQSSGLSQLFHLDFHCSVGGNAAFSKQSPSFIGLAEGHCG